MSDAPTRGSLGSLEGWGRSRIPFLDRLPSTSSISESSCAGFSSIFGCSLSLTSAAFDILSMRYGHAGNRRAIARQMLYKRRIEKERLDPAKKKIKTVKINRVRVQRQQLATGCMDDGFGYLLF